MFDSKISKRAILSLAALTLCGSAYGQFDASKAFDILTQGDGARCQPQAGAQFDTYRAGCCGSPGNRFCLRILHDNKGSNGDSDGCTDPDDNRTQHGVCLLPPRSAVLPNGISSTRDPVKGTDLWFLVTSDLHFYRDWYNVSDQAAHPFRMNQFAAAEKALGHPYAATMIVGDLTTGPSSDRIGAYRLLWEQPWLPGASTSLLTFPTLGNHDSDHDNPGGWRYIYNYIRGSFFHLDRTSAGCLVGVDAGCAADEREAGSMNYSFDWQGVHMVMLNTWAGDQNVYVPAQGSQGMTWLRNDLAHYVGSSGRPVIIFQHYGMGDINTRDTNHNWWTPADMNSFVSELKKYNVISWFSGHTHWWGTDVIKSAVNANNGNPNGVGQALDNLVDGAGGDCHFHGTNDSDTKAIPETSTFCSSADAQFFAVHVTDNTMTVRAMNYNDSKGIIPYEDTSIGLPGIKDQNSGGNCIKRFGRFTDVTAQVTISADYAHGNFVVHNNSGGAIPGPLAIAASGLTSWDYTDSCVVSAAQGFVHMPPGGIAANGTSSVGLHSNGTVTNMRLYQLDDTLALSERSILVGTAPVTVTLSSVQGRNVPFSYTVPGKIIPPDGFNLGGGFVTWLKVTTDSTTTPAHLTVTITNPSEAIPGDVVITAADPGFPTITLRVAPNAPLTVTGSAPGAYVFNLLTISGVTVPVPEFLPVTQQVQPDHSLVFNVPSPQYPSPGTKYTFKSWSSGGPQLHPVVVPLDGATETVHFDIAYQLTTTPTPGGSVAFSPTTADGYYPANSNVSVTAKPASGYRLVGFTGDASGLTNPGTVTVAGPLTIGATFSNTVAITVSAQPSTGVIYVDHVPYSGSHTFQWVIGEQHLLDATITDPGGGVHQVFHAWNGGFGPRFSYRVPAADALLSASFDVSYLLTLKPTTNGTLSVLPASADGYYPADSQVSISATPSANYFLSSFNNALSGTQNPQLLTLKGPSPVGATFQNSPSFKVTSVPPSAVIYVDNVAYTGTNTFLWAPGSIHTMDASRTDAGGGVHQAFAKWSVPKPASFNFTAGQGNLELTATFAVSYHLTLNPGPNGALSALPPSPDGYYADGTPVILTATPTANFFFASFTGDINGNTNPQPVTMFFANVGALFTGNPVTTISTLNDPLPITVDGVTINSPAQLSWVPGSTHTIGMAPVVSGGPGVQYLMVKWSDGLPTDSRSVVAGNTGASYQIVTVRQFLVVAAGNPVASGTVGGAGWYNQGAQAKLTATASGGYAFSTFTGDFPVGVSTDIFTVNAPASVVANFTAAPPQLNLTAALIDDKSPSILKLGLAVANSGIGTAAGVQITSITATVLTGSGTVSLASAMPVNFGSLAGGTASPSQEVDFDWPTSATRVRLVIKYAANGGLYSGTQTLTLFR